MRKLGKVLKAKKPLTLHLYGDDVGKASHWFNYINLRYKNGQHNIFNAVWTRLELATSAVTGRHSNQLNYQTV